ncbi:hypothetical protein EDC96DRAFT_412762, partial [Choanephora cucurbitarum]
DPNFRQFLGNLKALSVKTFDKPEFDLQPAILQIRSWGGNQTMSTERLTQKLSFLLAITGFLRNADIHRINLDKVTVLHSNTQLRLVVDCPKEKRNGSPIERIVVIRAHDDPLLCPVQVYQTYRVRIAYDSCLGPHPTRPSRTINFLVRSLQDFSKAVGPQTISRHIRCLLALVEVRGPTSGSLPLRARAVGSTNSVMYGANIDDILAHGSWSSCCIFDNFYRLSRETATNFTALSLS